MSFQSLQFETTRYWISVRLEVPRSRGAAEVWAIKVTQGPAPGGRTLYRAVARRSQNIAVVVEWRRRPRLGFRDVIEAHLIEQFSRIAH